MTVAPITEPMNKDYQIFAKVQVCGSLKENGMISPEESMQEMVLIYRDIESIPVFAKEGAIVPLGMVRVKMCVDFPLLQK